MPPSCPHNRRKDEQLGMPTGTAFNRLRKRLMFELAVAANRHICFRCQEVIGSSEELSVEHKVPWQKSATPRETFFDMANIAFSHLACNVGAGSRAQPIRHGKRSGWYRGCRCELCVTAKRGTTAKQIAAWRARGLDKTRSNYGSVL